MFDGTRVDLGPGTLWAASIGTSEPTSVSGSLPSGWTELGYTDTGSEANINEKFAAVEVEEEVDPIAQVPTGRDVTLAFSMAEITARNWAFALNGGITGAANITTLGDGSLKIEPPPYGSEQYVMLCWDALSEGSTPSTAVGRFLVRKAVQTGTIKVDRRKGATKALIPVTFSAIKPAGVQPFALYLPGTRAS